MKLANKYKPEMTKFLRNMIAIPSESCGEKEVVLRIKKKWKKVGFDKVEIDIMGRYGIPCVGFGPGHEDQAHAPNEKTFKSELVKCAAMYALIPLAYLDELKK